LLETPFPSQTGAAEVRAYVQSKYSLALLSLGSFVRAHGIDARFGTVVGSVDPCGDAVAMAGVLRPRVIGLSLGSYCLDPAYQVAVAIKRKYPDIHICVGGPHVNIYPAETLALEGVDSIVVGDGEEPFLALCRQIIEAPLPDSSGLPEGVYLKGDTRPHYHPATIPDLDALPPLDLTFLGDYRRYREFLSNRVLGLVTSSRGCPHVCRYCRSEKSVYRPFSVDHVIEQLRLFKAQGVEHVEFWDETFNASRGRLEAMAEAISRADLRLTWSIRGAVVNHAPLETLKQLKASGLRLMQFGIETGSPRLLQQLNKRIDVGKAEIAFANCRKAGIRTVANLMMSLPGETRAEMEMDLALLKRLRPTYVSLSVYNWAPGTTLYEEALASGTLAEDVWRSYARQPRGDAPVLHPKTEVPIDEVYRIRDRFHLQHYFNPGQLARYLKDFEIREIPQGVRVASLMLGSACARALRRVGDGWGAR
jgi:radical SAM superfamily enzyme YgiQ (UPF0313 family)